MSTKAMKAAVNHLEKFMEKADTAARGKVLLATVKGGLRGVYHSVSAKWLQGYLNEYTWRYNHREHTRRIPGEKRMPVGEPGFSLKIGSSPWAFAASETAITRPGLPSSCARFKNA